MIYAIYIYNHPKPYPLTTSIQKGYAFYVKTQEPQPSKSFDQPCECPSIGDGSALQAKKKQVSSTTLNQTLDSV